MKIVEIDSNQSFDVGVSPISKKDLTRLTKRRYWFNWKQLARDFASYKLTIDGDEDILGVMALADHPDDKRIEIKVVASSKENVGQGKKYESIVINLLAFACAVALAKYGEYACVSLVPKTLLKEHYIKKYKMLDAGRQIFLDGASLINLAKQI